MLTPLLTCTFTAQLRRQRTMGHAAPQECGHKRLILQGKLETGDVGEGAMAPAEDERFQPKKAGRVQRRDPVEICHAGVGFQPP